MSWSDIWFAPVEFTVANTGTLLQKTFKVVTFHDLLTIYCA